MNNSYTTSSLHQSATLYRICIQGALDQRWADSLGGMSISTDRNTRAETVTTLSGRLPDQAALFGILNLLYDLRCSLLLVELVTPPAQMEAWQDERMEDLPR